MNGETIIDALKKKFGVSTDIDLADTLGITNVTLHNWRHKGVSPRKVAHAIKKATVTSAKNARQKAEREILIKPITEFQQINKYQPADNYWVFQPNDDELIILKNKLDKSNGIYLFYDSRGRSIYAGKTTHSLWSRINQSFNNTVKRSRIYQPKYGTITNPKSKLIRVHEVAEYFSAYEVERNAINDFEALIVRAFANDLTNHQMPRFRCEDS